MAEKEVECCDAVEVHENLLKIVNETMPEETELYDLAELFKAEQAGEEPQGGKIYFLFSRG